MEKKQIELTLEQARKLYAETKDEALKQMLEINFPILLVREYCPIDFNDLLFCSPEQSISICILPRLDLPKTESIVAYAKLASLMDHYCEQIGWTPSSSDRPIKWQIYCWDSRIDIDSTTYRNSFLTFKTKEHAELFLETHRDLVEQYFML